MKNQTPEEGTEVDETTEEETTEEPVETPTESEVDYKKKFSESSKEAQRLLEENKKAQEELEKLRDQYGNYPGNESDANYSDKKDDDEPLYPGFENLSEEEQQNLLSYTDGIKKQALKEIYKDPAIVSAREQSNERAWEAAFNEVSSEIPDLKEISSEFKSKYFKKDNVPSNIKEIITQLAKSELYDKAKDLGAREAEERSSRIDIERSGGGDKTPKAGRTMEDWQKLAQSNPAKFAKMSKEYNEDLSSGKLK